MEVVFILLLAFLGIGLFTRRLNNWTRLLLIAAIVVMILFSYLT